MPSRFVVLAVLLFVGFDCRAVVIADANLHFSFTLPDAFVDNPSAYSDNPSLRLLRAFYLPSKTVDPMDATFVSASDMGMPIRQESLAGRPMPAGLSLKHARWHDFDLDIICREQEIRGAPMAAMMADIPLVPHAVRLTFVARKSNAAELEQLMRSTVASVKGDTNWSPGGNPVAGNPISRWVMMLYGLCGTVVIALGGVLLLRLLTKGSIFSPVGRPKNG